MEPYKIVSIPTVEQARKLSAANRKRNVEEMMSRVPGRIAEAIQKGSSYCLVKILHNPTDEEKEEIRSKFPPGYQIGFKLEFHEVVINWQES